MSIGSEIGDDWRRGYLAGLLSGFGVDDVPELCERVAGVLDERAVETLATSFDALRPGEAGAPPAEYRRRRGVFFTPPGLAEKIARRAMSDLAAPRVADLSCGDGELLVAAIRQCPGATVIGVERELVFAVAAALRLAEAGGTGHRVRWDDGLRPFEGPLLDVVVGNPPYVGEKGNRELFSALRQKHPDLESYFGARLDLHYLFIHRAVDALRPGGRLVYLTSEYWLTATGADRLRRDLFDRAVATSFERLGAGEFPDAPGHHSLVFEAYRRPASRPRHRGVTVDGTPWHPFATVDRLEGAALGDLVRDRQGFVSGADRTTRRHRRHLGVQAPIDAPVFVWHRDEIPGDRRELFRPLVRRSDCSSNAVFVQPPGTDYVLWADGEEDDATRQKLEVMLEEYRPLLERRREARNGSMPWYRIWWPRKTAEYAMPKLVVPRRATKPMVCLDLSGSHVSSDCTFMLAPADVVDPVRWLATVMVAANSDVAFEQLRSYGKTKGDIVEFYSEPLRTWRLPLRIDEDGELRLTSESLEAALEDVIERLGSEP